MSAKTVVIAGAFHQMRVARMLEYARREAKRAQLDLTRELWVPGAFEVPFVLDRAFRRQDIDAAIVLGVIERGKTEHGLVMGQAVFAKLLELELQHEKPVGLGIIGPGVAEQYIDERLEPHARAAVRAVRAVLDMAAELSINPAD